MKSLKSTCLTLGVSLLSLVSQAQEKYSKVKIPITSASVKQFVFDNLDVDHYQVENNAMLLVLNRAELASLQKSGYAYQMLVDDVVATTIEQNSQIVPENNFAPIQGSNGQKIANLIPTPVSFGLGGSLRLGAAAGNPGYFTYTEMVAKMQALATAYPALASVYSIGAADDGTVIYGIKISDNVGTDENEPEVLYTALQHAREAIGGTSMIFFMQYLLENYASDARIQALVNSREIFIVPCCNPEGYAYNYDGTNNPADGGGLWRKNRRQTGSGPKTYGVDLNRNYSVDWGNCSGASSSCGSTSKSADTYFGTSAFSEPETQALRNFVYGRRFVAAIDQHCTGPYYSLPYGRPTLHPALNTQDSAFYAHIPALMGTYNGHRAGNSPETVNYEVAGGIKDWWLMGDIGTGTKGKIYGMTGEAGGGSFWAPVNMIIQLCKENCFQNLQLAYAAGAYYDTQDLNDVSIPGQSGKFGYLLRRIGLDNAAATVSVIPLENIATVGTAQVKTINTYYNTVQDSIAFTLPPDILPGSRVKYVWAVSAGGITTYDTVVKIYQPISLFSDDMEGSFAAKWTATISPSGPAGWGYSTDYAYAGSASLAESPGANYTTSSTRTLTCKTVFDLSDANDAFLSFWVRHKAENFRDKLQVQISTNNVSWTPIANQYTIAEDNTTSGGTLGGQPALTGIRKQWTRMIFDLTPFKNNNTVYLRFVFTSDSDAGSFAFELDEGFNIDNMSVVKGTDAFVLPLASLDLAGNLLANKTVMLKWHASTDARHDHFILEKATHLSQGFAAIKNIYPGMPFEVIDANPAHGENLYRLRQVDKDGHFALSNVVSVKLASPVRMNIYPNPVKDVLHLRMANMPATEILKIEVTDVSGKIVYAASVKTNTANSEVTIPVQSWPAQSYAIRVVDSSGELVHSQKFIKH